MPDQAGRANLLLFPTGKMRHKLDEVALSGKHSTADEAGKLRK